MSKIDNKNPIFYFELIKDYKSLKDACMDLPPNSELFKEFNSLLRGIENPTNNFINNANHMISINKLLFFIEEYNKSLNALNIINNIEICNEALKKHLENYSSNFNQNNIVNENNLIQNKIKFLENKRLKIGKSSLAIKKEIENVCKKITDLNLIENKTATIKNNIIKLEQTCKSLLSKSDYLSTEAMDILNKILILENNVNPPKHWLKKIFSKQEQVYFDDKSLNEIEATQTQNTKIKKEGNRILNTLLAFNNKLKEDAENIINNDPNIKKINENLIKNIKLHPENKQQHIVNYNYLLRFVFIDLFKKLEVEKTCKPMDFQKINVPISTSQDFMALISNKINEINKKAYNGLILTNLDEVVLQENSHLIKIQAETKLELKNLANKFRSKIFATTAILSSIVLAFAVFKENNLVADSIVAGVLVKKILSIFSKDTADIPSNEKKLKLAVELVDNMFENFNFKITNIKEYISIEDKFKKSMSLKPNNQKLQINQFEII
jgi:hypothetical protein